MKCNIVDMLGSGTLTTTVAAFPGHEFCSNFDNFKVAHEKMLVAGYLLVGYTGGNYSERKDFGTGGPGLESYLRDMANFSSMKVKLLNRPLSVETACSQEILDKIVSGTSLALYVNFPSNTLIVYFKKYDLTDKDYKLGEVTLGIDLFPAETIGLLGRYRDSLASDPALELTPSFPENFIDFRAIFAADYDLDHFLEAIDVAILEAGGGGILLGCMARIICFA